MDDESIKKLADVVSGRVFEQMSQFVGVIEGVVRENELLRARVADLELSLYDLDDDDVDYDDEADEERFDLEAKQEADEEARREFFDVENAIDDELEEEFDPTFD